MSCISHPEPYQNLLDSSLHITYIDNQNIEIQLYNKKTKKEIKWIWGSLKHFVEEFVYFYKDIYEPQTIQKPSTFFIKITKNYFHLFKEIPPEKLLNLFIQNVNSFFDELKPEQLNFNNFVAFLLKNYSKESIFLNQTEYDKILKSPIIKKYQTDFQDAGLISIDFWNLLFNICTDEKEYNRQYFISNQSILEILNEYMGNIKQIPIEFTSHLVQFKDEKDTFFFELKKKFGIKDSSDNVLKFLIALDRYFNNITDKEQKIQYNSFIEFIFSQNENFVTGVNDDKKKKEMEDILLIPRTEIVKRVSPGEPSPHLRQILIKKVKEIERDINNLNYSKDSKKRNLEQSKKVKIQSIRDVMSQILDIKRYEIIEEFNHLEQTKFDEINQLVADNENINDELDNLNKLIDEQNNFNGAKTILIQNIEDDSNLLEREIELLIQNGIHPLRQEINVHIQFIEAQRKAFNADKQNRLIALGNLFKQEQRSLTVINGQLTTENTSLVKKQNEIQQLILEVSLDSFEPRIQEINRLITILSQIQNDLGPLPRLIRQNGDAVIQVLEGLNRDLDTELQRITDEERRRIEEEERRRREEEERLKKEEEERIAKLRADIEQKTVERDEDVVRAETLKQQIGLGSIELSQNIDQFGSGLEEWKEGLESRIAFGEEESRLREGILHEGDGLPLGIETLEQRSNELKSELERHIEELKEKERLEAIRQQEIKAQAIADELARRAKRREELERQIETQRQLIVGKEELIKQIYDTIQDRQAEIDNLSREREEKIDRHDTLVPTLTQTKEGFEEDLPQLEEIININKHIKEYEELLRGRPKEEEIENATNKLSEEIEILIEESRKLYQDVNEELKNRLQTLKAEKGLEISGKSSELNIRLTALSDELRLINETYLKKIDEWIRFENERGPKETELEGDSSRLENDINSLLGNIQIFNEELENEKRRIEEEIANKKRREEENKRRWTEEQRRRIAELEKAIDNERRKIAELENEELARKEANNEYERIISQFLLDSNSKLDSLTKNISDVSNKIGRLKEIGDRLPGIQEGIERDSNVVMGELTKLNESLDKIFEILQKQEELVPLHKSEGEMKSELVEETKQLGEGVDELSGITQGFKQLLGEEVQLTGEANQGKEAIVRESNELNEGITKLMKETGGLSEEIKEAIERNQMARSNFNSRKSSTLDGLNQELVDLTGLLGTLSTNIQGLETENSRLGEGIKSPLLSIESSLTDIEGKVKRVKEYLGTINQQREELNRLEPEILRNGNLVIGQLTELDRNLDRSILEVNLGEARETKNVLEVQRREIETRMEEESSRLGNELDSLEGFLQNYKGRLEEAHTLRDNLSRMETRMEGESENVEGEIDRLRLEGEEMKVGLEGEIEKQRIKALRLSQLEERRALLRASIQSQKERIGLKERTVDSLRTDIEGKSKELDELRETFGEASQRESELRRTVVLGREELNVESEGWRSEFERIRQHYNELNRFSEGEAGLKRIIRGESELLREEVNDLMRESTGFRDELWSEFRRRIDNKESSLQTRLSNLLRDTMIQSENVQRLETFIQDITTQQGEELNQKSTLREGVQQLGSDVDSLLTQTTLFKDELTALSEGRVAEARRLESLRSELQSLEEESQRIDSQLSVFKQLEEAIQRDTRGVGERLLGIENMIGRIQSNLIDNPNQLYRLQREIQSNGDIVIRQLSALNDELDRELSRLPRPEQSRLDSVENYNSEEEETKEDVPPSEPVVSRPAVSTLTQQLQQQRLLEEEEKRKQNRRTRTAQSILNRISRDLSREVKYKSDISQISEQELQKLQRIYRFFNERYNQKIQELENKQRIPKIRKYLKTLESTKLYKELVGDKERLSNNDLLEIYEKLPKSMKNITDMWKVEQNETLLQTLKDQLIGDLTRANRNYNIQFENNENLPQATWSERPSIIDSHVPNREAVVPYTPLIQQQRGTFSPVLGTSLPIPITSVQGEERVEEVNNEQPSTSVRRMTALNRIGQLPSHLQGNLSRSRVTVVPSREPLQQATTTRPNVGVSTSRNPTSPSQQQSETPGTQRKTPRKAFRGLNYWGGKKEKKITIPKKQKRGKRMK